MNAGTTVLDHLEARGMVEQISNREALSELLAKPGVGVYCGFDPTADSLHVGHLLPIMAMAQLQRAGHAPIMLVGGATGMIGDPSGKDDERQLLTADIVERNVEAIRRQLSRFVSFEGDNAARMVNNMDWIGPLSYIEWLRDVGKHFSVNYMIAKESVKRRISEREQGISYTEFSYMMLQAYDFLHLCRESDCRVQAGGNDQWGNITAGIDLTRKVLGREVHGFTFPLVTTSAGEKFGKSAGNAVWLDAARTSPFQFFQYWINVEDADVGRYLKYFTFLDLDEIAGVEQAHLEQPQRREGQRRLAEEMTRLVHGEQGLDKARRATQVLFGAEIADLSDNDLGEIFADVPATRLERARLDGGLGLVEALVTCGVCKSNGEARRAIQGGGVYVNNRKTDDAALSLTPEHLAGETTLVLRQGKKRFHLLKFE